MDTTEIGNSTPKSSHGRVDRDMYNHNLSYDNYFKSPNDIKSNSSNSESSDKFNCSNNNNNNISFNSNMNLNTINTSQESSNNTSSSICGTGSAGTTANSPNINRNLVQTPKIHAQTHNKWNFNPNGNGTIPTIQGELMEMESAGVTGGGDAPVLCGSRKIQFSLDDIMRNINALGQAPENLLIASALVERLRQQKYACGTNIMNCQERYSRKVFVGGLPPDIDEQQICDTFSRFGPLTVDWPHKCETRCSYPPKGYAFLLFQHEHSVQKLIGACICEEHKLYMSVSSPTIKDKSVQIRPWRLSDADFVLDANIWLDPRKTVFVGGVPRPLKASELALVMNRYYGGVCYASIDTDPELKYPKGAARVCFSDQQSYIAAISARFVHLQHADIEKRVEVKPYVLDDQICDECKGLRCGRKYAPFFCANVTCLQYYCEHCWVLKHSRPGREFHKPLVKEGTDRPRPVQFLWN